MQQYTRSSHQRCFVKKDVLRNFAIFTGKHLCQSLFFNKVTGLRPATLFKKLLWHRCFPVNFAKFLRTPFTEHLPTTASVDLPRNQSTFLINFFLIPAKVVICFLTVFSSFILFTIALSHQSQLLLTQVRKFYWKICAT